MKRTNCPSRKKTGFTLTELLVVIAVIGVLSAILIPVVGQIKTRALQTKCATNLRTWGAAFLLHAQEHGGEIRWKNWASVGGNDRRYEDYIGGDYDKTTMGDEGRAVFITQHYRRCPAQEWDQSTSANGPVGYAMTRPNPKVPNGNTFNIITAAQPVNLLLMMDAEDRNMVLYGPEEFTASVKPLCTGEEPRHGGNVNILFADGHVNSYTWEDLDGDNAEEEKRLQQWFSLQ